MGLALVKTNPPAEAETMAAGLIILGLDDRGRPHASRFEAQDAQRAETSALAMGMTTLAIDGEVLAELAAKLPAGKLFASGKAFVPFVGQPLFDRLVAYLPIAGREALTQRKGGLVKASAENGAEGTEPADGGGAVAQNSYAKAKAGGKARSGKYPESWDKITIGNIVLALAGEEGSWWPALIRENRGDGVFVLVWEGWDDLDPFVRNVEQIALLHPNYSPR